MVDVDNDTPGAVDADHIKPEVDATALPLQVKDIDGQDITSKNIEDEDQTWGDTPVSENLIADIESCFHGYENLHFVYASNQLYVVKAFDSVRHIKVFLKAVLSYDHVDAMTRIKHEWNCQLMTNELPNVKKPHAIESCNEGKGLMLVFADDGERPSHVFFDRELSPSVYSGATDVQLSGLSEIDLHTFMTFAIDISKALGSLHAKGITHGNINPFSIGVNQDSNAMLFDLTCSTFLEREDAYQSVIASRQLPFMSPESSGRINRSVDYRSDFYSLGASFYFLLTGRCPFTSDNALDLIYYHIAREAIPPHEVCEDLPKSLSAVILKLMAKTAEDRYQTALGLVSDLTTLREDLLNSGGLNNTSDFEPGLTDAASQFNIPQKLFGREDDVADLLSCFQQVKDDGGCNVVIIKGGSGTGKSSLVNEIHRPVLESKSFFAGGKFDQYKRGVPFFSLIQAGSELVRQLVSGSEVKLDMWKNDLTDALGADASVIFDVLPELRSLYGIDYAPAPMAELGPAEREQRFTAAFLRFIMVFGRKGYPLVLFLDDIQWSSVVELNLIAKIAIAANSSSANSLCIIIAYRDNEVPEGHHALSMLREINENRVSVRVIEVKPMTIDAAREMIAQTMRIASDRTNVELETLTKLIVAKSGGNAFFITQLLKSLESKEHLFFDFGQKAWRFDLPSILLEDLPITVVELLLSQMHKLGRRSRHCLHMAACIGTNRFSLQLLAAVTRQPVQSTSKHLWNALQAGLIVPTSSAYKQPPVPSTDDDDVESERSEHSWAGEDQSMDATYRFLHDRVQQAAYQLFDEADQTATHLAIGFRLLAYYEAQNAVDTYVFEIVNQINRGLSHLTPEQLFITIDLNLRAGKRALHSTAFDVAMSYLEIAKSLAPESWWTDRFDLSLEINLTHVDATYANHDYDTVIKNLKYITTRARTPFEQAQIMFRMIDTYNVSDDLLSAIDVGISAMQLLGFVVPRTGEAADNMMRDLRPKLDLTTDQIDEIPKRPLTSDQSIILLQTIASSVLLPIYCTKPELLQILCAQVLLLALEHGLSEAGAYSLLMYGVTLTHGDRATPKSRLQGYHMGLAAVKIVDRASARSLTATTPKVLKVFASHICWWNEPARACLVYYNSAMSTGLQMFNVEYTCYAYVESCTYAFYSGEPLQTVIPRLSGYLPLVRRYKQKQGIWYCAIQLQAYVNLASETGDPLELDGEHFSMALEYDALVATVSHPQLFVFYLSKLMIAVLFHRPLETCLTFHNELKKSADGSMGTIYIAKWSFFVCSCLIENFSSLSPENTADFYYHLSRLKFFQSANSSSFDHEVAYLEAEAWRQEGRILDALEKFEASYSRACDVGHIYEAGHIAERTYRWLEPQNKGLATKYLFRAHECFKVSGFMSKTQDLIIRYPDILSKSSLGSYTSESLIPFRSVNMQINRDGTLSKVSTTLPNDLSSPGSRRSKAEPINDLNGRADVRSEASDFTRPSKGSKDSLRLSMRPPRSVSGNTTGNALWGENDLTPTGTVSSHLSKQMRSVHNDSVPSRPPISIESSNSSEGKLRTPVDHGVDLDLEVALRASVMISDVLHVSEILERLVETVLVNAGADYGALLLVDRGNLYIEATGRTSDIRIINHECLTTSSSTVPASLVNYVGRLKETVVLGTGQNYKSFQTNFGKDTYFAKKRLRSIMCMPVQNSVKMIGVLYLENSITAYAFGARRVELLNFLCTQAAIAIEKARLYSDLEIAKNEAQASNKMKSEFLSTISHEIRTPFNAVLGMSGFLLDTKLTPMQVDYVETIRNSSKELLRVIDDILDFSKMEHGTFELHKENFSLRECIEGAMQITAERAASKELELAYFNHHSDFPDILVNDITRFRQVIINLLGNSIKFTEKGSVTLTSNATLLRAATNSSNALYRIQVSVADTGIGIEEADHKKLFKLFSQIDSSLARNFSGTGLGLAISEKLVRLMDGQIWVDSQPGVGSTFHFTITTEARSTEVLPPAQLKDKLTGRGVLILDDSEVATRALAESLQWLGMNVVVTRNTDELAHVVATNPAGSFSVALIDLHYGLADAVLPELARYDTACKIIRLSRFGVRQHFDERYQFLIKPVKRERLARVVAEAIHPDILAEVKLTSLDDKATIDTAGLATRHPLRILLAEDNMINARVAIQHLKRMGYSAVHAKDGQYAIEEESKAVYDVILMDVQMPRLDGFQAATKIRAKYAKDPDRCPRIIAMTANAMRGDMERCLEAGMHSYAAKPIIVDVLARRLLEAKRRSE